MTETGHQKVLKDSLPGLTFAFVIGIISLLLTLKIKIAFADPLVIALLSGILIRTLMGENRLLAAGFRLAPAIFIPIGIIFYSAHYMNFVKISRVETRIFYLLLLSVIVYFAVILFLGRLLKQKKQITYLTATGSAICGASAIAITSPAVNAEPEDTAISLLAVALTAFFGFSVILPFLTTTLNLSDLSYSLFSGGIIQFTGLVKVAMKNIHYLIVTPREGELLDLALSVKSVRFLGLLIAIPIFSSLVKKRISMPVSLWLFLFAGISGTFMYISNQAYYETTVLPVIHPIHNISWSIALAAIGLNADVKQLFSNSGAKALIMAFTGFLAASIFFLAGLYTIQIF